jgi:hypothetical protein
MEARAAFLRALGIMWSDLSTETRCLVFGTVMGIGNARDTDMTSYTQGLCRIAQVLVTMQKHEFDQVLIIVTTMLTYRPTTVPASAQQKEKQEQPMKKANKSKKRGKEEEEEEPIERTMRARVAAASPTVERKRKNVEEAATRPVLRARLAAVAEERKRKADDESSRPTLRARTKLDLGPAKGKDNFLVELFVSERSELTKKV